MYFIDFFSGAGGMRMGLEQAGHRCVGFCEWDKYARQSYKAIFDTEGEWEGHDIRDVAADDIPHADLWCYGFPCQDISVAGKQKGLFDENGQQTRSGLFFEIIRLLANKREEDKPEWLVAENVKNLLSFDKGFGFARLLVELDEAGYDSEWQLFNTKYSYIVNGTLVSGIPQNRERVYIISHLRSRGKRKILPVPRADRENPAELRQVGKLKTSSNCDEDNVSKTARENPQRLRVYSAEGLSPALNAMQGGGLNPCILNEPKSKQIGHIEGYAIENPQAYRVYDKGNISPTLTANGGGGGTKTGWYTVGGSVSEPRAVLTPDREEKRQNGRRMKDEGEPMFTLTAQDKHGVAIQQVPVNANVDGTSRCICAGLYKQNWSHFDPTRGQQTYTGVVVREADTDSNAIQK